MWRVIVGPEKGEQHIAANEVPSRSPGKVHEQGEPLLLYVEELFTARAALYECDGTERSK